MFGRIQTADLVGINGLRLINGRREMTEISITWSIDDVLSVRPNLSKEQASSVLMHLKKHHDATVGINWDVIEAACDDMFDI